MMHESKYLNSVLIRFLICGEMTDVVFKVRFIIQNDLVSAVRSDHVI